MDENIFEIWDLELPSDLLKTHPVVNISYRTCSLFELWALYA